MPSLLGQSEACIYIGGKVSNFLHHGINQAAGEEVGTEQQNVDEEATEFNENKSQKSRGQREGGGLRSDAGVEDPYEFRVGI